MLKNRLLFVLMSVLVGCSENSNTNSQLKNLVITKDTIPIDEIIYGVRGDDLKIKYFNQSGKEIEYEFNDTLYIELLYKSKYKRLNNNHSLKIIPLTDNLKIYEIGKNKYTLHIDSSKNLNVFKYQVDIASDVFVFKNTYPKLSFSSEMGLVFKIYNIDR